MNYNPKNSRTLKPDAVPTLQLPAASNARQRRMSIEKVDIKQEPIEKDEGSNEELWKSVYDTKSVTSDSKEKSSTSDNTKFGQFPLQ